MKCGLVALAVLVVAAQLASTQQLTPATIDEIVKSATAAQKQPSPTEAAAAFNESMNAAFGPADPVFLLKDEGLNVVLLTPLMVLRGEIAARLRKLEPIGRPTVLPRIQIVVEPKRIDAPDIVKVVVMRDGAQVPASMSTLAPQTLHTAAGGTVQKHAGILQFPTAAFRPGAKVHVSVIPATGENMEIDLSEERLQEFFTERAQLALSLVKLSTTEVEQRLGKPARVDGHRWTYTSLEPGVQLAIYFDDANTVVDVNPKTFNLARLK